MKLAERSVISVPDESIGGCVIDEVFDVPTAERYQKFHVLSNRCEKFIARDAGDNLIVEKDGIYLYWDHESNKLIPLGANVSDFIVGYEE
jgi:hypothetical protein